MALEEQQRGTDLRATLAISMTEALAGTSRVLTLPDGRQVNVLVPAGTRDGRVIGVCPGLEPKVGKGISPKSVRGPRRIQDRGDIYRSSPLAHSCKLHQPRDGARAAASGALLACL